MGKLSLWEIGNVSFSSSPLLKIENNERILEQTKPVLYLTSKHLPLLFLFSSFTFSHKYKCRFLCSVGPCSINSARTERLEASVVKMLRQVEENDDRRWNGLSWGNICQVLSVWKLSIYRPLKERQVREGVRLPLTHTEMCDCVQLAIVHCKRALKICGSPIRTTWSFRCTANVFKMNLRE